MQMSVALRNAGLDAYETATGASPKLRLLTGNAPANCAAAQTGTQLGELPLPSDWMAAASAASKALAGSWTAAAAAAGLAGYFRITDNAGTTCHWQGLLSQAWAASTAYVLNQQVNNGGNVYRCTTAGTSAGAGGPTGTGAGISDGTAVWTYVGPVDMVLDNTNINSGQTVQVTSFTLTAGNA